MRQSTQVSGRGVRACGLGGLGGLGGLVGLALAALGPIATASATTTSAIAAATETATETRDADPVGAVLDARVGQRVPDITLPDLTGAPRSLTELRGQRAMLHVFASW